MARLQKGHPGKEREREHSTYGDPNLFKPHWSITYRPLRADDGRIIDAFYQARDVSAQLRAEAAMHEARDGLEASRQSEATALALAEERHRSEAAQDCSTDRMARDSSPISPLNDLISCATAEKAWPAPPARAASINALSAII